jgi:two-component system OmpR family response regulator
VRPSAWTSGDLRVDHSRREATYRGAALSLTTVEFDVIGILVRSSGRVVTREEISQEALGRSHSPYDRSVDMHVSNLRRKLQAVAGDRVTIKTVRSAGYLLVSA